MIKFITDEDKKEELTLGMVEENQFFVSFDGRLCQKLSHTGYCVIADGNGFPFCDYGEGLEPGTSIKRILPRVTKIEF